MALGAQGGSDAPRRERRERELLCNGPLIADAKSRQSAHRSQRVQIQRCRPHELLRELPSELATSRVGRGCETDLNQEQAHKWQQASPRWKRLPKTRRRSLRPQKPQIK